MVLYTMQEILMTPMKVYIIFTLALSLK